MKPPCNNSWSIEHVIRFVEENAGTQFEPCLVGMFTKTLPQRLEIKDCWNARENATEKQK